MATQDQVGIIFSISHEQQNFRLMELPLELADSLTSTNPPTLQLKSAQTSKGANDTTTTPSYAVLSTGDKTYQIRQVSTSNSVFLLQPTIGSESEDVLEEVGITAVATINSTLELLPESTNTATTSRKWHERFKKSAK